MSSALAGTRGLIRLILRRDRFLLPLWILVLALVPIETAAALDQLYPTAAALRDLYGTVLSTPGLLALLGPAFGATLGALTTWRVGLVFTVVGLVSLLTVIRHTRTDEEVGRRELLGATVVGRLAPLTAALLVTFAADLVLGAVLAAGMLGLGLPAAGSVALGLSVAAAGWMFATIGALTAQLTQTAGGARGLGLGALGLAYLLRAAGDTSGSGGGLGWLSWLSPVGWAQQTRSYAAERWWVFALAVAFVALVAAAAYALLARRDVGAGVLPARLGPTTAAPSLRSPLALAWRLHKGMLLGWTAGLAVMGGVIGSVADSVNDMAAGSSQLKDVLERLGGEKAFSDAYIAGVMIVFALVAAGYAIQATLRLRTEEEGLRAEPLLATPVGRLRWAASHLLFGLLGPTAALVASGLAEGFVYGLVSGDVGRDVPRVLAGAMVQLPAVLVLAGIAMALFGLLPRFASLSWAALAVFGFLVLLGPLLQLSQWVLDAAPFNHIPKVPGAEVSATPLAWLLAGTTMLVAAGLVGFRRRDLVSSA
ncbi:MAG TPA: ABC transporter permease [Actinomycetota bacterium]|jgi:ABC-2 type transport system permease protein|nr:ABC transporter permease [Actinomycetota bacterium]